MFHKNSKAIAPLKYRLGISELWSSGSFITKKKINNIHLYNLLFLTTFLDSIINLLFKTSHKLFRFQIKNKKRKLIYLYKKLLTYSYFSFIKILLKLKIRKKLRNKRILFIKKKKKI